MWLPKDERKLLMFYYKKHGGGPVGDLKLQKDELIASMKELKTYDGNGEEFHNADDVISSPEYKKVFKAHWSLRNRNLIHLHDSSPIKDMSIETVPPEYRVECLSFTTEGSDLGRKYSHWFTWLGLFWQEHKDHPIWLVISLLTGIAIGKIT